MKTEIIIKIKSENWKNKWKLKEKMKIKRKSENGRRKWKLKWGKNEMWQMMQRIKDNLK